MNEKDQFITLNFRIEEETVTIEKVNISQPLEVSVKKALKDNPGRPIED